MRRIITGVDEQGRSCVLEDDDVSPAVFEGILGVRSGTLWATETSPPPSAPEQVGEYRDLRLTPGQLRWIVVDHDPPQGGSGPEICTVLHHQDALELVFIVSGSTTLVVDTDERALRGGDCVVLPGVDHAFETGVDGCRMLAVAVGL